MNDNLLLFVTTVIYAMAAATSCLQVLSDSVASRRMDTPFLPALEGLHRLPSPDFCPYFNSPTSRANHALHILYQLSALPKSPALFTLAFPGKRLPSLFLSSIRRNAPVRCWGCLRFCRGAHSFNSAHLVGTRPLSRASLSPF